MINKHDLVIYSALYPGLGPLSTLFPNKAKVVHHPSEMLADKGKGVLILHGGEDIFPGYYGQKPCSKVHNYNVPSTRDRTEKAFFELAVQKEYFIIGICRGAQLACSILGGKLIQHVDNHMGYHDVLTYDGRILKTNSAHHQMMYPWEIPHELLAYSIGLSNLYVTENDKQMVFPEYAKCDGSIIEPELVWFPQARCLAVQGHPEWMEVQDEFIGFFFNEVNQRIDENVEQTAACC